MIQTQTSSIHDCNQVKKYEDHFDISRIQKNIFSNPFHQRKLGLACAQTCYHRQMKRMYKRYPEKFIELKDKILVCNDTDCSPRTCHKIVLSRFLKKI